MVPVEVTEQTDRRVAALLSERRPGHRRRQLRFSDDGPRAERLAEQGIGYVDCGVSGGVWGMENGYALMVGGADARRAKAQPIFDALKPAGEFGFVHAGGVGAGHYAKMVHNGIEYGLMHAYAEGWELLSASEYVTNVPAVIKSWRKGTVVRSWLLDLLDRALDEDPELDKIKGYAEDTGEGRWTVDEAVRLAVPMNVDRRLAVCPLPVPAGRLAGDEGGGGAAQSVRRPRCQRLASSYVRPPARTRRLPLVIRRSSWSSSPAPNVLVGPNGVGKTNLVEALGYVATLDSHRVATDAPLVRRRRRPAIIRCGLSTTSASCSSKSR